MSKSTFQKISLLGTSERLKIVDVFRGRKDFSSADTLNKKGLKNRCQILIEIRVNESLITRRFGFFALFGEQNFSHIEKRIEFVRDRMSALITSEGFHS
jgi:hypothetical protein